MTGLVSISDLTLFCLTVGLSFYTWWPETHCFRKAAAMLPDGLNKKWKSQLETHQ